MVMHGRHCCRHAAAICNALPASPSATHSLPARCRRLAVACHARAGRGRQLRAGRLTAVEAHDNAAGGLAANLDVKEDLRRVAAADAVESSAVGVLLAASQPKLLLREGPPAKTGTCSWLPKPKSPCN